MSETTSPSYLKGHHILAVDDEEDILETIEELLGEAKVDRAKDYDSAMTKLREHTYDLAILDIMGVNGLELLVETVNRGVPTVMLTAHAMNPDTLNISMTKGALGYLPKEELSRLDELLGELLAAHAKGQSTWKLLFQRLGDFFDNSFGQDWARDYPDIVKRYGGPGRWHDQG